MWNWFQDNQKIDKLTKETVKTVEKKEKKDNQKTEIINPPEETPSTGDTTEEVTNPETSDSVLLIVAGMILSIAAGTFALKQLKNHA